MNLGRRIKYYMVGALIGVLLSFFIFNGRGCEWLPGARVLNSIQTSKIITSEKDNCLLSCNNISERDIYQLIENGSINFGESDTDNKNYVVYNDSISLSILINETDTTATINNINSKIDCDCANKKTTSYTVLYQPNDIVLERLSLLKLSIKDEVKCELDCFGVTDEDIDKLFLEGEILFKQSYPNRVPNPIFYIKLTKNEKELLFWIEQGATKTRLKHVVNYNKSNLKKGEPLSTLFEQSMKLKDCNCY